MNFTPSHDPLGSVLRPRMLIATKPSKESVEIFEGEAANLHHNFWTIQSDDPTLIKGARVDIDWNYPIGFGGVLLTSPRCVHDLATAKICVVEMASSRFGSGISAQGIAHKLKYFMWMLRWRLEIKVKRLDQLTPSMFRDFCDRFEDGGQARLIGFLERLERLTNAVRDGKWAWPVHGPEASRRSVGKFAWAKAAHELGTTMQFLRANQDLVYNAVRLSNHDLAPSIVVQEETSETGGEDEAPDYTVSHAANTLWPFYFIHLLSSTGTLSHDRLNFDPFAKSSLGETARRIAGRQASDVGEQRTRTISPQDLLTLIDAAARWVLDYSEPVLGIAGRAVATSSVIQRFRGGWSPTPGSLKAYREKVSEILAEYVRLYPGRMPDLIPVWKRGSNLQPGLTIYEALVCVVAACFIVIAAFSARRKTEIESLKVGCAVKDQFGDTSLAVYIEKTIRDIDRIPVPSLVLEAVRILEELGREGREANGDPWLGHIRIRSPDQRNLAGYKGDGTVSVEKDFSFLLVKFCEVLAKINPKLKGLRVRPHEFRRAFAVMYYHGNRYSTLDALSRFLRHFDPEMTRRYVTEGAAGRLAALAQRTAAGGEIATEHNAEFKAMAELVAQNIKEQAALVENVRQEAFVERALEVLDGTEHPIGHGARTLRAELDMLVDLARNQIQLGTTGNGAPDAVRTSVADLLREHARTHYLEPHPGKHAHCRCRPNNEDDLMKAACLIKKAAATGEAGKRPDYAFSSIRDCLGCWHGIVLSENKRVLSERTETYAEAADKGFSDPIRVAAQDKLARLKASIRDAEEASCRGSRA